MAPRIARCEERRILAEVGERWDLWVIKAWGGSYRIQRGRDHLFIFRAVLLGHLRGRPRTLSQLARATLRPKSTLLRYLDDLIKDGHVRKTGQTYCVTAKHLEVAPEVLDEMIATVQRAASALAYIKNGTPLKKV